MPLTSLVGRRMPVWCRLRFQDTEAIPVMIGAPHAENENARQRALERYALLDTGPEPSFDNLTALLAHVIDAPVVIAALQDRDRDWFKSRHGIELEEVPAGCAFRSDAMEVRGEMLVVDDARERPHLAGNPLVAEHGLFFCTGVPLRTPEGIEIGMVYALDRRRRLLEPPMNRALVDLARQLELLLEMRLQRLRAERRNAELSRFAGRVAHDLKSPISGVGLLADALAVEAGDALSGDAKACVEELERAAGSIAGYVDELLEAHLDGAPGAPSVEPVDLAALVDEVEAIAVQDASAALHRTGSLPTIRTHRTTVLQVLLNLVTNAVKYADAERVEIDIRHAERDGRHAIAVADDGRGIAPERLETLFERGAAGDEADRYGRGGTGQGLAEVRGLLERIGGTISVESTPGRGSTFTVSLPGSEASAPAA